MNKCTSQKSFYFNTNIDKIIVMIYRHGFLSVVLEDTLNILPSQNLQISQEYSVVFLLTTGDKPKNLLIWQVLVS